MNFKQNLTILFYLVRSKKSKDGKIPIYVRVTIDGLDEEFSSGCKVLDEDWDPKKQVLPTDKSHKELNKTLNQINGKNFTKQLLKILTQRMTIFSNFRGVLLSNERDWKFPGEGTKTKKIDLRLVLVGIINREGYYRTKNYYFGQ